MPGPLPKYPIQLTSEQEVHLQHLSTFYVAAIVKPLFPFFPSLASFLEELCHIVLISLHTCILVLKRTGMAM
jgi:hypothetical protein